MASDDLKSAAVKSVVGLMQVDTNHVPIPRNYQRVRLIFKFTLKVIYHTALQARSFGRPQHR